MSNYVQDRLENGILTVVMLPTPGNVLTEDLCHALLGRLEQAMLQADVRGVVISAQGPDFCRGLDLSSNDIGAVMRGVSAIGRVLDAATKPVVAALKGRVFGLGFELSLCAHARVAQDKAVFAMPDLAMGLIPGAGGTQRLPRLIGAQSALELLLSLKHIRADHPRLQGLLDRVTSGDPEDAAADLAQRLSETGEFSPARDKKRGFSDPLAYQSSIADISAQLKDPNQPEAEIVACVEAAQLLPFDQGLTFEAVRAQERIISPAARLLRHAVLAERRAAQLPQDLSALAVPVEKVVVMGRSAEAADLASMALSLGHHVCIESGAPNLGKALANVALKRVEEMSGPGTAQNADASTRLHIGADGNEMEEADLILDTGELTPDPPAVLKPDAVWLMTSPTMVAEKRAAEVLAEKQLLRLQRPFRNARLFELSAPVGTRNATVATAHNALCVAGQSVVMSADTPGGLVGSLFAALCRCALRMLAAGVSPSDIEQAARGLGMRQGPLQLMDILGAGRSLTLMRRILEHRGAPLTPLRLLSDRIADVTDGEDTKAGRALVFHTQAGQSFARDPDFPGWVHDWRTDYPDRAINWPDVSLDQAMLAAMVNEAARLRRTKAVHRLSDIDLAAEKGLFMDRKHGGPLIQADLKGLLGIARTMRRLTQVDEDLWTVDPLITDMIKTGDTFF